MAVKLRLQRKGRKGAPFYHIVAADARAPRDGRFIEKVGTYNPLTSPATIELNRERAFYWVSVGAQPTDTVNAILRFKGVLLKKHLQLGVKKGALTQEEADAKLAKWIEQKETSIAKRREESADAKRKFVAAVDGTAKVKAKPAPEPAPAPVVDEETAEIAEAAAVEVAAEEAAPAVEAAAEEAAPAVEAAAEVVAETSEAAAEEKSEEA